MVKNLILGAYTLLLVLAFIAFATHRLTWADAHDERAVETLERAIEMHRPEVLDMGDMKILHIPTSKMKGTSYSVSHKFFINDNGVLKPVDLTGKSQKSPEQSNVTVTY